MTLDLVRTVGGWRAQGSSIVLTNGVFDLFHEGHQRYLQIASRLGDKLIVGIDSDDKVRLRKGTARPRDPFARRATRVNGLPFVSMVFAKRVGMPQWHYVRLITPDVLVISKESYSAVQCAILSRLVGRVVELPRTPGVSSTRSAP